MHKIIEIIDHHATKKKCDKSCKHYTVAFEHRERACILSDVYSVNKGQLCSTHSLIES